MSSKIDAKLKELDINLPKPPEPVASYIPYVVTGNLVFISGQLPVSEGQLPYQGRLGKDYNAQEGEKMARLCGINILAQLKAACDGNLDRVKRCVRLGVFVASSDSFTEQPTVANGASNLMQEVFGEKGRHARSAVSCNSLPLNSTVEVDAVFELE